MPEKTYFIPEQARADVEKLCARFARKAARYGAALEVSSSAPYVREVPIIYAPEVDALGLPRFAHVEGYDVTISADIIRRDGFTVAARIEHGDDGNNIVNAFNGADVLPAWLHCPPRCQHCNGSHGQKVTFIVRNAAGAALQVGRTCLRDYCGIDPAAALAAFDLSEILSGYGIDADGIDAERVQGLPRMYPAGDVLALACRVYAAQGYRRTDEPGSNKGALLDLIARREQPTPAEMAAAADMVAFVRGLDDGAAIASGLNNVRACVAAGYVKAAQAGIMAAAPLFVQRARERAARDAERAAQNAAAAAVSQYVGAVGDRLTLDLSALELCTSWETQYGVTYLYKMRDVAGNVLVWFASRMIDTSARRIKCTVKDHSTRDGIKQTIVTRCAVA